MSALATATPWLVCPVCRGSLTAGERALACESGHSFDVARQGYVNLLGRSAPANADTVAMVAARDRFLSAGHYDPITRAVASAVPDARRILEVGAGTGHHLAAVLDHLPDAVGVAADVSVPACRRAARGHPRMASVVADTWSGLPLANASVDAVLCIFAPRNPAEFARVLRPDGVAVVVVPSQEHLQELRHTHQLLQIGEDKVERLTSSAVGHLQPGTATNVAYDLDLTGGEVGDLIAMGPNAFHTRGRGDAGPERATVRVSVTCAVLRAPATS